VAGESVNDPGELGGCLKVPDTVGEHDEVVDRRACCKAAEVSDDIGAVEGDAGAERSGEEM